MHEWVRCIHTSLSKKRADIFEEKKTPNPKTFSIFVSLVNSKYENICVPATLASLTTDMAIFRIISDKCSSRVLALLPSSTYNYF